MAGCINAMHLKDRLRISRPIIEIDCIAGSSESWKPQAAPTSMALSCRGRSGPQHQFRTHASQQRSVMALVGAAPTHDHPLFSRNSIRPVKSGTGRRGTFRTAPIGPHAHGPVNRLRGTGSDEISTNHFPNSAKTGRNASGSVFSAPGGSSGLSLLFFSVRGCWSQYLQESSAPICFSPSPRAAHRNDAHCHQ